MERGPENGCEQCSWVFLEEAWLDIELWNPHGFLEKQGWGLLVMIKERLLETSEMSQMPSTWMLFLQIPAIIKKGIRKTVVHLWNSASGRVLDTICFCFCFLFFTFLKENLQTYRKREGCNEHLHAHHLKWTSTNLLLFASSIFMLNYLKEDSDIMTFSFKYFKCISKHWVSVIFKSFFFFFIKAAEPFMTWNSMWMPNI